MREDVSIPANNELRYAGHHFIQAVDDSGVVADHELLRKALSHARRAMYEAAEAGIMAVLKDISTFRKDYEDVVIGDVVPSYADTRRAARAAQALLARGRGDRESVEEHVESFMATFRDLRARRDVLHSSRDDLNVRKHQNLMQFRRFVIGTTIGLTALMVAVWRLLVAVP